MDRGYYSADNINALYKEHLKFLCGTSTALSFVKAYIREIGAHKDYYEYYNSDLELYVFSRTISWDYEQERPYSDPPVPSDVPPSNQPYTTKTMSGKALTIARRISPLL